MDAKLAKIYYSPQGYWKGISAIKTLAEVAKVSEDAAKQWLIEQALWQIYLPAPQHVPRPKFDVATPNSVHQVYLLFQTHDKLPRGRKVYKYALTVVDVASRYNEEEPLTSKDSAEVAKAFQSIYRRSPLTLQVDPGREFMGSVTKEMESHKTYIRRGRTEMHRDQAIVERFNRSLAERLFGHQYAVEMLLPVGQRSTAWVKRLPEVVKALNNEVTSLIGKRPAVAIKEKAVASKPSTKYSRPVGMKEKKIPPLVNVRYLYQPGELEGGTKRATDSIWSLKEMSLSLMSRLSVICWAGPSAGLFMKSCWLCHLIRSSPRPDCSVPVRQRVDSVARYPALCIEWRERDLVHAHSVHLVALTPQDFQGFFVVLVRYLSIDHIFFHPVAFFMLLSAFLIEYIFGLNATTSFIGSPPHSSFILPRTFLFLTS